VAFRVHTLRETEELALELGYDGLELMLPPRHLPPEDAKRDENYGVLSTVRVVHAPGDWFDERRYISSLREGVRVAEVTGAAIVNAHPAARYFGGERNVARGVAQILQLEKETGLTIAYEGLVNKKGLKPERQQWFAKQQAHDSVAAWVDEVREHDLSATLDTCHVGTWGEEPAAYLEQLGDRLRHVHFSDYSRLDRIEHLVPGEGDVDLTGFLQALRKTHPDITLTIEISPEHTAEGVRQAARQSLEYIAGYSFLSPVASVATFYHD